MGILSHDQDESDYILKGMMRDNKLMSEDLDKYNIYINLKTQIHNYGTSEMLKGIPDSLPWSNQEEMIELAKKVNSSDELIARIKKYYEFH